jgi:hypothetical protein
LTKYGNKEYNKPPKQALLLGIGLLGRVIAAGTLVVAGALGVLYHGNAAAN